MCQYDVSKSEKKKKYISSKQLTSSSEVRIKISK